MSELTNSNGGNTGATGGQNTSGNNAGGGGAGGQGAQGGAGGGQPSWLESLSAEYRDDPNIKNFKSHDDLAKSYIHAQKMIGAEKIVIPGKQATDDDWAGVFAKLGRPESADKYEFKQVEGHDAEFVKSFKESAFKAGLLPKQVEALYGFYSEMEGKAGETAKTAKEAKFQEEIGNLKKEWPDSIYDKNLGVAKNAVKNMLDDTERKWLDESGLGNDPRMIKLMFKIGNAMAEDKIKGEGGVSLNEGPDSAQAKLNAIMGDSKHPYYDSAHPNHALAVKEVQGYYNQINKK